jgi:hypothetical protein
VHGDAYMFQSKVEFWKKEPLNIQPRFLDVEFSNFLSNVNSGCWYDSRAFSIIILVYAIALNSLS